MSDTPDGPGWWMADDGKWYAPQQRVGDSTAAPTLEPAQSSEPSKGRRRVVIIAAIAAIGVLAGGVAALLLTGDDDDGGEAFGSPDDGEVFLEPADEVGDDAFTDAAFVTTPVVAIDVEVPDDGVDAIGSSRGSTPGLFGGTRDEGSCDRDAMAGFFDSNPDHAAAFVDALAADPTWRADQDSDLGTDQLAAYLETLTPVLLTADTRVTNHGYRDGAPLPFQTVLQAGTAVLVDINGVPRVRCACGNPLTAPAAARGSVTYTGTRWSAFDTTRLMVVQPAQRVVEVFVLVDVTTGDRFERPAGTAGGADTPVGGEPEPPPTTQPPTTEPPTTTTPPTTAPEDRVGEQLEAMRQWALATFVTDFEFVGLCDDYRGDGGEDIYCAILSEDRGEEVVWRFAEYPGGFFSFWLLTARGPDGWFVADWAEQVDGSDPPF